MPGADRGHVQVDLQELFVYDDPGHDRRGDDEDDDVSRLEGDLIDLEPLLRDAVVLALPFQPLCRDDCPGLCTECGARLADDPDTSARGADRPPVGRARRRGRSTTQHDPKTDNLNPRRPSTDRYPRSNRGCPEAEDVAQQHPSPSFAVEGHRALAGDLRQPGLRRQAPAAPCLPRVRPVRRPGRPSSGPLTASDWVADLPAGSDPTDELREALGDPVLDPELLELALTHRSYAYENGGLPTNERLEFLGDSVLGVVDHRDALPHPPRPVRGPAGQAARRRGQHARAGRRRPHLGLGAHIRLGKGEETTGGRDKSSILADTVEALIGAVYLSGGFEDAARVVHLLFDPLIEAAAASAPAWTGRPACRSSAPLPGSACRSTSSRTRAPTT